MSKSTRAQVYGALDTERDYQERGFGNASGGPLNSEGDFIAAIHAYLDKMTAAFRVNNHDDYLDQLRKVTALGVQGMERLGARDRVLPTILGSGEIVPVVSTVVETPIPAEVEHRVGTAVVAAQGGPAELPSNQPQTGDGKDGSNRNTGYEPNAGAIV